jgi:SAM-dependent methyltransferase
MTLLGNSALAEKETLAAPYDPLAPHYDAFRNAPGYEEWLGTLLALAAERGLNGGRALDVGCGTGRSVAALIAAGFDASGVDPSPGMLEVARRRLGAGVELGVSTLPEPLPIGPKMDLITAFNDVVNYVEPSALSETMTVLAARLRPGGLLLFDANTPLAYATFFSATRARDTGDRFFVWDPQEGDGTTFSVDLHAFIAEPDAPDASGGWTRTVSHHTQHHHSHARVVEALRDAGFELLATRGAHDGGDTDPIADDATHIKRIYLAQLPCPR